MGIKELTRACSYVYTCKHVHTFICVYVYVFIGVYVYMVICVHVYVLKCAYVFISIICHLSVIMRIKEHMRFHMYICINIYPLSSVCYLTLHLKISV